ncbi:MAG TPA: hypothetical protein VK638_31000 [Edaphobacter sp.]|nr:hypothetical protein [Edaphobacter sp.]
MALTREAAKIGGIVVVVMMVVTSCADREPFASPDRTPGGHLLNCRLRQGSRGISATCRLLPNHAGVGVLADILTFPPNIESWRHPAAMDFPDAFYWSQSDCRD